MKKPAFIFVLACIAGMCYAQQPPNPFLTAPDTRWQGRGISTDVVESSIKAYVSAINALEWEVGE
jgi:hypothetical protein